MSTMRDRPKSLLTWSKVLPGASSARYQAITGTDDFVEGLKVLCDSGYAELAQNAMETFAGSRIPIFIPNVDFIPQSCAVYEASSVLGYDDGHIYAVHGYSGRSNGDEFACIVFNVKMFYIRVCSLREVERVWEVFNSQRMG